MTTHRTDVSPRLPLTRTALSVALLAVLYLWVFPYHTAVNNPNENVRIYMTVAMVDDGTFALNRIESVWGYVNDKAVRATPLAEAIYTRRVSDGVLRAAGVADDVLLRYHRRAPTDEDKLVTANLLYSSKAPGTSMLGVPAYWLLTRVTGRNSHLPVVQAPVAPVAPPAPPVPDETAAKPEPGDLAAPTPTPTPAPRPAAPVIARPPPPREPIERTKVVYAVRLFANVLPGLLFAWFWHRFLASRTRSAALREAVFFSTMAASSLYAYGEVFASHAHNAWCIAAAIMALAIVRERDEGDARDGRELGVRAGWMFLAGITGAGATLFEYPAGIATGVIALWILAINAERNRWLLGVTALALAFGARDYTRHHSTKRALLAAAVAFVAYLGTLRLRNLGRLVAAGAGGAGPVALAMLYHKRAFGDAFKTGYSFLENPTFRSEVAQGFFGATSFSWEAGLRLWFDPAFGLVPSTFVFLASIAGVGAMLSWRPRTPWATVAVRTLLSAMLVFALTKLTIMGRRHTDNLAHAEVGPWLLASSIALIGVFSVTLPAPTRRDRATGVAILMISLGMTFLIGMMNNWRGGWQVGPRYLVTVVPALGIAALAGLDAMLAAFDDAPIARRVVTVFAAGATVTAFLVTGLPSAYFPHIPTEYTSPFFEMMLPVMRDGFVPHNAGHLLDLKGNASMLGFALAALGALAIVLRGDERRTLPAITHAVASLAVALVLLVPMAAAARLESAPVTRYVKSAWEPRPPDAPAAVAAPPGPNETSQQAAARARRLTEAGDTAGAYDAWLRSIRAPR